jgi:hypothetical protein
MAPSARQCSGKEDDRKRFVRRDFHDVSALLVELIVELVKSPGKNALCCLLTTAREGVNAKFDCSAGIN